MIQSRVKLLRAISAGHSKDDEKAHALQCEARRIQNGWRVRESFKDDIKKAGLEGWGYDDMYHSRVWDDVAWQYYLNKMELKRNLTIRRNITL